MGVRAMNLMDSDQLIRIKSEGAAPPTAHFPGVVTIARRRVPEIAVGFAKTFDSPRDAMDEVRNLKQ